MNPEKLKNNNNSKKIKTKNKTTTKKPRKSINSYTKAFSMSIVTRNPSVFNESLISVMSEINPTLFPINMLFT